MSRKSYIRPQDPHPYTGYKGGRITARTRLAVGKALQLRKQRTTEARRIAFLQWSHVIAHNRRVQAAYELADAISGEVNPNFKAIDAIPFAERHLYLCDEQKRQRSI